MRTIVRILDVDVDAITLDEAVRMIGEAVDARRGHGGASFQVATINPEFVMLARRDSQFRGILREASLRVPDAVGMILAARILGRRFPERVPGVELVLALARAAAERGDRLFLLGAAPGVAAEAAARLVAATPGLQVAGVFAGDAREAGDPDSLSRIRASGADVILVAFGAPAQEAWASRNLAVSGAAVAIGVGGTFDYLAGRTRRAPRWMRRVGMEWLFRLITQPWRARRMLVLPMFMVQVLRQRMTRS